jgi:hypothetical protein
VVFSLSDWQPDHESLREWMAASLAATCPGAGWSRELLASGRVLPVLDGLDEIPAPLQAHAMRGLNAELDPGDPVLLTCRTQVYAAVAEIGDVFTASAVVELQPLAFEEAGAHLVRTARPTASAPTPTSRPAGRTAGSTTSTAESANARAANHREQLIGGKAHFPPAPQGKPLQMSPDRAPDPTNPNSVALARKDSQLGNRANQGWTEAYVSMLYAFSPIISGAPAGPLI